ncbi:MAG: hypothetical protein KKB70_12255, partial [Proteobacteria bacterium]|nr:hypothetical protein [Pseudomonadota bacterium]
MMKLKKGSKINLIGTALILVFAVVGLIGFLLLVVSTTAEVEQTFQEPVSYVQPALQNQLSVSFYSLPDEQVPTGILLSAFGADLRPVVLFPVGHKPAIDLGYTICDNDTKVKPLVIFSDGQRTYFYFGVSQLPDQSNRQ